MDIPAIEPLIPPIADTSKMGVMSPSVLFISGLCISFYSYPATSDSSNPC